MRCELAHMQTGEPYTGYHWNGCTYCSEPILDIRCCPFFNFTLAILPLRHGVSACVCVCVRIIQHRKFPIDEFLLPTRQI